VLDLGLDHPDAPVYRGRRRLEPVESGAAVRSFPTAPPVPADPADPADPSQLPVVDLRDCVLAPATGVIDLRDLGRDEAPDTTPDTTPDTAVRTTAPVAPLPSRRQLAEQRKRRARRTAVVSARRTGLMPTAAPAPASSGRGTAILPAQSTSSTHSGRRSGVLAVGAAGVAVLAAVAGQAVAGGGIADAASGADELASASATSTLGQIPDPDVSPAEVLSALRLGAPSTFPSRVRATSRSTNRPVLPGCDGKVTDFDYPHGQVPADELCALTFAPGHHLRADAAVALARLNIAYRAQFGHNLCLTDSYRTLAAQESLAARKPGLAARPGTSEHGMGLAVDFCDGIQTYGSSHYDWMRKNAPAFGWDNPTWAIPPSSREEPWHWEYVPGEIGPAAADT
jgi:hypothetical protein